MRGYQYDCRHSSYQQHRRDRKQHGGGHPASSTFAIGIRRTSTRDNIGRCSSYCLLLLLLLLGAPSHSFHPISSSSSSSNAAASRGPSTTRRVSSALLSETNAGDNKHGTPTPTMAANDTNNSNGNNKTNNLSVGFIGCGTIASSIARGLILAASNKSTNLDSIVVSKRSESKSKALVEEYSQNNNDDNNDKLLLSVTEDNQEILDRCDLIFLTVLPQQASSVLQGLEFDPNRHILVSLVSTANLQDLMKDSKLDMARVSKMICLPSIASHKGVALLCCGDNSNSNGTTKRLLVDLFGAMGGVVALDTEADLEACMVTTCTMGPLYGTMKKQRDWLLNKTDSLSKDDATFLVIKQFAGAIFDAERATSTETTFALDTRLEDLIEEQTPGGLNEQALKNYGQVLGGFEDLQQPVMDAILSRIRGETDGSIDRSK
mmetsp:Transcript_9692/g.20975  ORF Transcript_9692/g.20975 Transcript_9692/m.20975 type:complete len:433 (+) Transcript_9692:91-1389(+)